MENFKMFVVTHKEIPVKLPENYIPIQVGKCNTGIELPYIRDDSGDNISLKNSNYCELTAIYWLWKNYDLPQYVGICHYRRYLVKGLFSKFIDEQEVIKEMENKDVILPEEFHNQMTVYDYYIKGSGVKKDIDQLRKIVECNYKDYLEDYDYITKAESTSYCNIAIMKREDFKSYCEWLFDVLFELEKVTDLTGYTPKEQRIYGYLSEFLLDVWIRHNKLRIVHYKVFHVKENWFRNILSKTKLGLRKTNK